MWVTSKRQQSDISYPLSLDDKITLFVEMVDGWQLDIADKCINGQKDEQGNEIVAPIKHSGFAVLYIVSSYFEMIAKFQDGFADKGCSKYYFKKGVLSVLDSLRNHSHQDEIDQVLDLLYDGVRCGLYHAAFTGQNVILTGDTPYAIGFASDSPSKLIINPHLLIPKLREHLARYEVQLRESQNAQLRKKFEDRFDYQMNG